VHVIKSVLKHLQRVERGWSGANEHRQSSFKFSLVYSILLDLAGLGLPKLVLESADEKVPKCKKKRKNVLKV
jgi:hypothetical protein